MDPTTANLVYAGVAALATFLAHRFWPQVFGLQPVAGSTTALPAAPAKAAAPATTGNPPTPWMQLVEGWLLHLIPLVQPAAAPPATLPPPPPPPAPKTP